MNNKYVYKIPMVILLLDIRFLQLLFRKVGINHNANFMGSSFHYNPSLFKGKKVRNSILV